MIVGLAGCGYLGSRHALKLAARSDISRLLLFDRLPERAEALAARIGARVARELDGLLEESDAVVVATSTAAHHDVTTRAIAAGCHVLVEKPIATTLAEADGMVTAARRADRVLAVGQVERFNPAVRHLAGRLAAPRFIEGHRLAMFQPRSLDIDVVLDLMIHDIDLALRFTGELPSRIDAAGTAVLTGRVDIANARLAFPGGCVANLTASRVSLARTRKIRFFMPETYVSVDLAQGRAEIFTLRRDRGAPAASAAGEPPDPMSCISHESVVGGGEDALEAEQGAFLRAARGEGARVVTGEEGRSALAVALEIASRLGEREP